MKHLSIKIRDLRKQKGLTQTDLAQILGVGKSAVSNYETGYSIPDIETLKTIAQYFGVTTDYLLGHSSDPKLSKKDEQDIAKRIDALAADLANQENLMLHGEIMDDETRELLKASLETAVKMSKIKAKEKFTPNKYKK